MDFVTKYGPSNAQFIAETYSMSTQSIQLRAKQLSEAGHLARWKFDGHWMYGLPEHAPGAELKEAA